MTSDIAKRQRTVPSAKAFEFNWRVDVPLNLQRGETFDRYDEETGSLELGCNVKVDEYGFFIYWRSDNGDGQVLELSQVSDVRLGSRPKEEKVSATLQERGSGSLDERVVTICSGLDLVNVIYTNMVAPDPATASTWIQCLRPLTHNTKANNTCPTLQLKKHWLRLCFQVNPNAKIPVRTISKTFASGKTEKFIFQSLKELGLPSGKNDDIDPSIFTFEKFYDLYHLICPRTDIEEVFRGLSIGNDFISVEKMIEFLNTTQRDPRLNEILFPFANQITIRNVIENYEPNEDIRSDEKISLECFYRYMMSDDNACVFLDKLDVTHDMDQPLSHYYINSSHNTYLIGRQFGGKSSVEMYRQVLLAGCRCIELDCWDGKGDDQEPLITHGKAMCTDVIFKDVIYAIRDTAFVTTDCPVILSFENHCSKPQQYKLAKYCEEILGDLLLTKHIDKFPLEMDSPLPSPNKLKRKILIKNKRLKPEVEKQQLEMFLKGQVEAIQEESEIGEDADPVISVDGEAGPLNDSEDEESLDEHTLRELALSYRLHGASNVDPTMTVNDTDPHPETHPSDENQNENSETTTTEEGKVNGSEGVATTVVAGTAVASAEEATKVAAKKTDGSNPESAPAEGEENNGENEGRGMLSEEEEQVVLANYHYTGATTNIHPYLSSLVNYAQPVKFQGFDVAEEENVHHHMSSFSETVALGYLKNEAIEFVNYNKRQMSRIYPRGNRVDSSNYMPQIFWNAGSQMVALNFQTPDLAMQLNQGKFEYNGNSGYLLKPEFMRRKERTFDPFSESPMDGVIAATCEVKVISGQFLSDKKVGTYVEVDMYGLPTDTIRKEFRTRVVPNNGLNPVYGDDAEFVFRKVVLPDLAVLRFGVYEDTGRLIGQRVLPLDCLQSGYRHISLRTEGNFPLSLPTIFCKITLSTYVPEGLAGLVDALSDPRAFLSKEEQRLKQLEIMGVKEDEVAQVPIGGKKKTAEKKAQGNPSNNPGQNNKTANPGPENPVQPKEKKDEPKFDPISFDLLKTEKTFQKLLKRQAKELEEMRKRHEKESNSVLKVQNQATDRLLGVQGKEKNAMGKKKKSKGFCLSSPSEGDIQSFCGENGQVDSGMQEMEERHQSEMKELVGNQTSEWTQLRQVQLQQEHTLMLSQIERKRELLKEVMRDAQSQQVKELRAIHDRESKEMRNNQTKISMESIQNIKNNDKRMKTKAERERRIKEVQENNTKMFIQQRTNQKQKQGRQEEKLEQRHKEQEEELNKLLNEEKEKLEESYQEKLLLATRPTIVI